MPITRIAALDISEAFAECDEYEERADLQAFYAGFYLAEEDGEGVDEYEPDCYLLD